ncbi:hypothetical protein [Agromyces bauzanensis]
MTNRHSRRRYRKTSGRRVWVFSEPNYDMKPEQVARIITIAGLEQARLEAAARVDDEARRTGTDEAPGDAHGDVQGEEAPHA